MTAKEGKDWKKPWRHCSFFVIAFTPHLSAYVVPLSMACITVIIEIC